MAPIHILDGGGEQEAMRHNTHTGWEGEQEPMRHNTHTRWGGIGSYNLDGGGEQEAMA